MTRVLIVTPAAPGSRKGNRVTAVRWAKILRQLGQRVEIARHYTDQGCDVLIALHARKSARSIQRYAQRRHDSPLIVALTGTDLYHDIHTSAAARESLEQATRLILLQPHGIHELPQRLHAKVSVIRQSARSPARRPQPLSSIFEVVVVGHLRGVKDPFRTAMAARQLGRESRIGVTHVGAALSESMRRRALREMAKNPRYRWRGELPLWRSRQLIARSRLLVLSSKMEGGANVLSEAIVAGVPVLSSRISGVIGVLGEDYRGYFEVGNTGQLTALLRRCESETRFYAALRRQCVAHARVLHPDREVIAWRGFMETIGFPVTRA